MVLNYIDGGGGTSDYPDDLNKNNQVKTGQNYFTVPVTNLKVDSTYSFQFQWVYPDGDVSDWSPGYSVLTALIATLPKPKLTSANISYFQGILRVTWDGTDYNSTSYGNGFSRILIWVRDNTTSGQLFKIVGELSKPGTWSLAVPPKSQTVKLTAVSVNGEQSEYSDEFTITPVIAAPIAATGLTAAWSGTDFTINFTHNTSAAENEYLKEYLITLNTATSGTKVFSLLPVPGSSQKFSLSLERNQAAFGTAETSFSGTIQTLDIYGNKGTATSFSNTAYVSVLQAPTIIAAATTNGYTVSYTAQTSNTFKSISIEEVVSSATTDPGTGYAGVATGATNPIFVPTTNTNKRWVRARLFDTVNSSTTYSTAVTVTPLSPVTVDNDGPPDVATVTTSGGLDNSGTIGFNGYADISWAAVTTGGIRGYRIRYKATTSSIYSYADSPGSGTSYRLTGLGAGLTYQIAVATYDEYNNTSSSYVSGTNVAVGGTPYIASTVDVTGFFKAKANPTDADSTAFKFGYGVDTGKRGLVFNTNNYWYIDSDQTALLKVGGATTNYIEWNGASFVIDGDLRAKKGSFSGNVSIASGASLYSGTLTGNTVTTTGDTGGSLSGAGYILNSSGLTFNSSSISGITTIDATTGLLTSQSANIGGWLISPSTNVGSLYKTTGTNTVKLDSAGYITVSGTGYETGIGYPSSSGSDANIVIWAGATKAGAPFKVFKDGSVSLPAATFNGYATTGTTDALSASLSGKINTGGAASDVNSNTTTINGGKIRTGSIQSTTWSGTVTNGSDYSTSGMNIGLDSAGSITAKNFRIDESGNAFFKGTLSSGISIDAPVITGGQIDIGNGAFKVSTLGVLEATGGLFTGSIRSGSTISGADITMTGAAGQTGLATTKLLFSASNYAISAGTSSFTYPGSSGYYDDDGDWISATDPQTVTTNDIRFTDASYAGAIPYNTSFYYGELWLGSGTGTGKGGSVDLWANHPTGYIGISIVADSSDKNIMIYGDSTAGFTTQHRSSTTDSSKESPAFLQVDSAGRMSRGRAVITGGSSSPSSVLGLTGDLYFSTAT